MIGFRVLRRERKVDASVVAQFRELPVANVSDSMSRMNAAGPRLRPMHAGGAMAGPALTVRTRPGDNLMLHKALNIAEPGDVIVVDAGGDLTNAMMGDLMLTVAITRGLAGIVINGAIRDYKVIHESAFPLFAAGVTHRGPYKDGPGEINVPIAIDGMVVMPGDLMLGDEDGLLCVPFEATETVYAKAKAKRDAEDKQMEAIKAGRSDRSWVEAQLAKLGCEISG